MSKPTYWSYYEDWKRRLPSFSEPTNVPRLYGTPGEAHTHITFATLIIGGTIAGFKGGDAAGLRFRAEHTHKLPNSTTSWYFYHKAKNYYAAKHGIQEGVKSGLKMASWTVLYFVLEAGVDFVRGGRTDFVSSTTAGVGITGIFSLINRFKIQQAARMARTGLIAGAAYGLLQDVLAVNLRGRRFNYIDALTGRKRDDRERVAV